MKEQKDKLDELIGNRIAERQRKQKRMKEMQNGSRKTIWMKLTPMALAACLIVAVVFGVRHSRHKGLEEASRAASPEIQQLIEKGEWDRAVSMVKEKMINSDSTICQLEKEDTTDEEIAYELQAERQLIKDMKQLEKEILKKMK